MSKCYTVFYGASGQYQTSANANRPQTLEGLIASVASEGLDPNAWAPEASDIWGGEKEEGELYAESIAAGRLIEKTASGWVALGAEKQETAKRSGVEYDPVTGGFTFVGTMRTTTLQDDPREIKRLFRKFDAEKAVDPNTAMILRDGPAKLKPVIFGIDYAAGCAPSTAKPNPFPTTLRSPDCDSGPSDHLNASRHQMAGMSKS